MPSSKSSAPGDAADGETADRFLDGFCVIAGHDDGVERRRREREARGAPCERLALDLEELLGDSEPPRAAGREENDAVWRAASHWAVRRSPRKRSSPAASPSCDRLGTVSPERRARRSAQAAARARRLHEAGLVEEIAGARRGPEKGYVFRRRLFPGREVLAVELDGMARKEDCVEAPRRERRMRLGRAEPMNLVGARAPGGLAPARAVIDDDRGPAEASRDGEEGGRLGAGAEEEKRHGRRHVEPRGRWKRFR